VLEVFGQSRPGVGSAGLFAADHGHDEREQDTGVLTPITAYGLQILLAQPDRTPTAGGG
jgi:hypothetical protein